MIFMKRIIIDPHNASREEFEELKKYLDKECWDWEEEDQSLKHDVSHLHFLNNEKLLGNEKQGILELINYVIDKRINEKATSLSYTELINLKNKLYE